MCASGAARNKPLAQTLLAPRSRGGSAASLQRRHWPSLGLRADHLRL
jgi:hypothetical protein